MSKDIIIQKSGVEQELDGVTKLRTGAVDGGTCDWVPEDEVQVGPLLVTANGLYKVSEIGEGLYGWNKVTTLVEQDFLVGTEDGQDYIISVDEDGYITQEDLPEYIAFVTLPTKLTYQDGESIDMTGAVIHQYLADGTDLGSVWPRVYLDPTSATYDPEGDEGGDPAFPDYDDSSIYVIESLGDAYTAISKGLSLAQWSMDYGGLSGEVNSFIAQHDDCFFIFETRQVAVHATNTVGYYSLKAFPKNVGETISLGSNVYGFSLALRGDAESGSFRAKKVETASGISAKSFVGVKQSGNSIKVSSLGVSQTSGGSTQTITVSWPRWGDGKVLTTSFEITVTGGGT